MLNDQLMGQVRQLVPWLGTTLVTMGVITSAQSTLYQGIVMLALGVAVNATGLILAYRANTKSSIVASASKMPEMKGMDITDPVLAQVAKAADPTTVVKNGGPTK